MGTGMLSGFDVDSVTIVPTPKRLTRQQALKDWKVVAEASGTPGLVNYYEFHSRGVADTTLPNINRSQSRTMLKVYKENRAEILALIPETP